MAACRVVSELWGLGDATVAGGGGGRCGVWWCSPRRYVLNVLWWVGVNKWAALPVMLRCHFTASARCAARLCCAM